MAGTVVTPSLVYSALRDSFTYLELTATTTIYLSISRKWAPQEFTLMDMGLTVTGAREVRIVFFRADTASEVIGIVYGH